MKNRIQILLLLLIRFRMIHDLKKQCLDILSLPWMMIIQHFKDNHAEGPDIAFVGIIVFRKDLRRHVDRHSHYLLMAE